MKMFRIRMSTPIVVVAIAGSLFLGGCDILGTGPKDVDIDLPVALNPESDIFSTWDTRTFSVSEGIIRVGKDTTFATRSFVISHIGDTVLAGVSRKRVVLGTSPGAAGALGLLGLNPNRLFFDTVSIPDPGPALRFPDTPHVGWKLDTTVGELRFVRRYTAIQNVVAAGKRQQCWVFTDSTYWGAAPVSIGTFWMGATGMVLHRQEWGYMPASITGGTFWREIRATN